MRKFWGLTTPAYSRDLQWGAVMMGLLKDALSQNMLEITEKRRRKEIFYLPNTINCTWSLRLG